MDLIKFSVGCACGFLMILITLIIVLENPDKKRYEQTIESLMSREGLSSVQEVLDSFPELKNIKYKLERIAFLKSSLSSSTGGPAPNLSKAESLEVQAYRQEIRQLRNHIKQELSQLNTFYAPITASKLPEN